MKTTTSTVTPISENPKQPQPRQTAKEVIAANVKSLIEQLEAGNSDALTAYLDAMSRFHNYSFGNILEIARQRPDATRVAGMYAWNQLGRKVKKGERGIRILAPIVGVKRKKDEEAEKDITKQNTRVLVGFRNAYVFERLSRDLRPRFYVLDVTRDAPRCTSDGNQYHRSIQLPCATIAGNGDMLPPVPELCSQMQAVGASENDRSSTSLFGRAFR
jgi:N-terminal domain of anti-restriction factor ArdC